MLQRKTLGDPEQLFLACCSELKALLKVWRMTNGKVDIKDCEASMDEIKLSNVRTVNIVVVLSDVKI